MVSACLEINTTRDIARQILRHRSFSFQEFSQRYADASQLGFEPREARYQDTKNRQNSTEFDLNIDDDRRLAYQWELMQNDILKRIQSTYEWALEKGIAKEQARAILPEGMTKSRMYMNGTLRSWIHYIQLRSGNGTQKEHREVAVACAKALEPVFPMITEFITQ
jgi:thymidylate synthase (FAD)